MIHWQCTKEYTKKCFHALFLVKSSSASGGLRPPPSLTLSSLLYAAPAWWGLAMQEEKCRLEAFLLKAKKAGFYPQNGITIENIITKNEATLFKSIIQNPDHVLHPFLPPLADTRYNLRQRTHPYVVPQASSSLQSRNFICADAC